MKKYILSMVMMIVSGFMLYSQDESSVKIELNNEERFRFEDTRISFINPYSSVHIGDSAGAKGLNTIYNVAIGKLAGYNDTAGFNNVYIGAYSGYLEFHGMNNTYIGFGSGRVSDSAYSNTFIGSWSGRLNTTGSINTFIGRRAGNFNTTGSENTFLGQSAGYANTTGSFNTYLGRLTGYYNQTGDSNIFIGYYAGTNDNSSNRLVIANSDTPEPLIYGEFDNKMLRLNAGRMEIRNALGNVIIGDSSGTRMYGYNNVIVGNRAGYSDTAGYDNVFIGVRSGYSNTTGYRNTFVGISAGATNTTGMRNTFVGLSVGAYNNTGSYNTYIGRIAGYYNETGDSNVFVGNGAGMNEMGSNKLYISNSETSEPLIYGDFAEKKLEFNADSVQTSGTFQASGEVRSDQQFNTGGRTGISDTINTVTSYSFAQNKLKYRTTIFTGGIITFLSEESAWVDSVTSPILHNLDVNFEDSNLGPLFPRVFGCGEWDFGLEIHPISESILIVDNPDPSGVNTSSKVMRFTRRGLINGGQFWAGFFPTSDPAIDFTYNKFIHVKIYKPRISPVKFKIENGESGELEIFSKHPQSDTNKWIDMVFDFSSRTGLYSAMALLPDYEDPLTLEEDIEIYFDDLVLNNDSVARTCGDSITIHHLASGGVAPIDKTITYGTVTNIPGEPSKCWITSNLGADHQADVIDDDTEASAGWYWQFNHKQGYKHDGITRTPNTDWISNISEDSDWTAANDPCVIELGQGWRLPAYDEWFNVDASGGWTNWNGPWDSDLKLQSAGYLNASDGSSNAHGSYGYYWSIGQGSAEQGITLHFDNDAYCEMNGFNKAAGISIRCIRD